MKEEYEGLKNPEQSQLGSSVIEDGEVDKVDSKRIEALMKSGKFESDEEAREFLGELDESLSCLKEFEKISDEFTGKFDNVIGEAVSQLEDIEGLSEGEISDSKEELQKIILGIAGNYGDLKGAVDGFDKQKTFSLADIPKKLGWFVKKNKAAFVAFTALSAFAKMGGEGEAEAGEIDWSNPDINADFERVVMENQIGESGQEQSSEVGEKISEIAEEIKNLQEQGNIDGSYEYNSESREEKIKLDADKLISEVNEKGEVIYDFKELVVTQERHASENGTSDRRDRMEIGSVFTVSQDQSFEGGEEYHEKTFNSEAESKEAAIMEALSQAAGYEGSLVQTLSVDKEGQAGAERVDQLEEVMRSASDAKLRISELDVEEFKMVDHEGKEVTQYRASVSIRTNI